MTAHFWRSIDGFCTYAEDYIPWLVKRLPLMNAHIVEVGVWAGQSTAAWGVELKNERPGARLDLVDFFGQVSKQTVLDNVTPVIDVIGAVHQGLSWDMAAHYADGSLDAVFIDASHEYEDVARDIDAWRGKVKPGGYLAGHDYCLQFPGVIRAVTERFAQVRVFMGSKYGTDEPMRGNHYPVWVYKVPQ